VVGLRTLCLAVVNIDPKFYADWNQQYHIASSSVDNRQQLVEQAAELIEKVCVLSFSHLLLTSCYCSQVGVILPRLVGLSVSTIVQNITDEFSLNVWNR